MKFDATFLSRMREATQALTQRGPAAATRLIQQALMRAGRSPAGASAGAPGAGSGAASAAQANQARRASHGAPAGTVDADFVRERPAPLDADRDSPVARAPSPTAPSPTAPSPTAPSIAPPPLRDGATPAGARFESHVYSGPAGSRHYKLYIPARLNRRPPLLLMLHGCTQDPDDFARGTRANRLADEAGCIVAYPEQPRSANPNRCWNWFRVGDQSADTGEPAVLAAIVQQVIVQHGADPRRVYAAGLSAGGAMATLLAAAFPGVFAAIGVHSGLPAHAATDVGSALQVMRQGEIPVGRSSKDTAQRRPAAPVPTIVFHGDKDRTVNIRNGDAVVAAVLAAYAAPAHGRPVRLRHVVERGRTPQGREYTRTLHREGRGPVLVEHWVIHGGKHAWAGGSVSGSHTEPNAPDATRAMWAFFQQHSTA